MIISLIVAIGLDGELGRDNELIWRISEDLKNFKRVTTGHHIILGRKTFESIGRPLPNRVSIVMTHARDYHREGCIITHSIDEALDVARQAGVSEVMICGGGQIYRSFLPLADRIYLTRVQDRAEADVYFPTLVDDEWLVAHEDIYPAIASSQTPAWHFQVLSRQR